jgi:hypothetical protein
VNSVVARNDLEAEVDKYAMACASNRSNDTVFTQKLFFEMMKQFQGEYMGSMLTGLIECLGRYMQPDSNELVVNEAMFENSFTKTIKDFDSRFPPEWRLSKRGRASGA